MKILSSPENSKPQLWAIRIARIFALVAICLFAGTAAHAEYAVMRSGARFHITGYEVSGATVRLHLSGGAVDVAANDILRFEPEEIFQADPIAAKPVVNLTGPYAELIRVAATKYTLDPLLLANVMAAESNFNPRAVSRKNAQGLMQLMPQTSSHLQVKNPFDPAQNIDAGAAYLKQMLNRFDGNVELALAAYNAGPDRVIQYGGIPPFRETQDYVRRITTRVNQGISPAALPTGTTNVQFSASKKSPQTTP
jgi:soluble lytic murein transglycosylase-like protein